MLKVHEVYVHVSSLQGCNPVQGFILYLKLPLMFTVDAAGLGGAITRSQTSGCSSDIISQPINGVGSGGAEHESDVGTLTARTNTQGHLADACLKSWTQFMQTGPTPGASVPEVSSAAPPVGLDTPPRRPA